MLAKFCICRLRNNTLSRQIGVYSKLQNDININGIGESAKCGHVTVSVGGCEWDQCD